MKSYPDLKQSMKLAGILPLESADMRYTPFGDTHPWVWDEEVKLLENGAIPCWSLTALLDVLPNNENISTNLSKGGYRISTLEYTNSWFVDYEDETDGLNNCVTSADNPIDACYEMILKLHELKML